MGALSEQELAAFSADFNKDNKNKVASRAARQNGLFEASFNDDVSKRLNHAFSTELDFVPVVSFAVCFSFVGSTGLSLFSVEPLSF